MTRRLLKLGILLVLVLGAIGHYLYWYAPRERPAVPAPGEMPLRLFASAGYDTCVWIPYPHQNLGALGESVDDGEAWLAAAARFADAPPPVLPSFGPFTLPPSHEIAACSDLDGRRYRAAARVYPVLGSIARLAGRLAGNPWLSGGVVTEVEGQRDQVVEHRILVEWHGDLWTVTSGEGPAAPEGETPSMGEAPTLGLARLGREVSRFPPGVYRLQRKDGDLELALDSPVQAPSEPPPFVSLDLGGLMGGKAQGPALLAAAGPAWPDDSPRPQPPTAIALFDTHDGLRLQQFGELPGGAVFHPQGEKAERWSLPGQSAAGLLSGALPKGNVAGWHIVALDAASLRRARVLAPRLSSVVPPDTTGSADRGGRLVLGLWFQPRPTLSLVTRIRRVLEKVPLVERRQVRRWRDGETLLAPLVPCDQVSLVATETPASFRLRFHGCGTNS
ncbi:MAG TPA: hypothetical protein VMW27_23110 [Thermoanaerobaculia bacterium]|nr:hypothetical protein [Thermoanaerobaculia bacterium]